ncbi:hypothetical protein Btru_044606 [Bulinus truncatus]|nr:hypothetical protein Btru_044606 [Bulinus truncatus]
MIWACLDGTYGYRCEGICRCKDELETCDKITGACESGCAEGYESLFGMGCRPISKEDRHDFHCHCISGGCPPGLGVCTDACQPGWMGLSCNISCLPGTYGPECTQRCSKCIPGKYIEATLSEHSPVVKRFCVFSHKSTGKNYDDICTRDTGTCLHGCVDGADCDVELSLARPEDSSSMAYSTKVTIITLVICAIIILFGGFVCKFFWLKLNKDEDDMYRFKEMTMKRDVAKEVNDQILREHMDYHENYLKRDILFKAQDELVDNLPQADHLSDKLMKKATFELKKPSLPKIEQKPAGQGKPLGQDHEQQDADVKVALWVLSQNFDEFIQRRKERLATYQGNILEMQESIYSIPKIDIEEDIHDLYDEIAPLELP